METPKPQSFSSHARWDPIFHFFALPVLVLLFPLYSIVHLVRHPNHMSLILLVVALALAINAFRTRTYPLVVQDRLVALEERLRLEKVLGNPGRDFAGQLTDDQLIGLRFAADGELAELCAAAISEKLSRQDIKRRVKSWRPDFRRA
jgi:hypothetical protein